MEDFKKFYVWGMNAKLYMGIYFAALVFLSGLLLVLYGVFTLSLYTLLQMLILSFAIALLQVWVLPISTDLSRGIFCVRSLLWLLFAHLCTGFCSMGFQWFSDLPPFLNWLLAVLMFLGCAATLLGLKFEQEADTTKLNDQLRRHKDTL